MKSRRLGCAVAVLHVPPRGAGAQVSAGMQGRRCALPVNRRHPRTQTTTLRYGLFRSTQPICRLRPSEPPGSRRSAGSSKITEVGVAPKDRTDALGLFLLDERVSCPDLISPALPCHQPG